jgi:hypothetical protein
MVKLVMKGVCQNGKKGERDDCQSVNTLSSNHLTMNKSVAQAGVEPAY